MCINVFPACAYYYTPKTNALFERKTLRQGARSAERTQRPVGRGTYTTLEESPHLCVCVCVLSNSSWRSS